MSDKINIQNITPKKLKASDYEMTSEVSDYLNDKIATIEKMVEEPARCEVEIGRAVGHSQQGNVWKAEIIVDQGGERLVAVAMGESVNAAIDVAKDEILQQLRKSKGKHVAMARRVGARIKAWTRFGRE